jgi:hypothetical protein
MRCQSCGREFSPWRRGADICDTCERGNVIHQVPAGPAPQAVPQGPPSGPLPGSPVGRHGTMAAGPRTEAEADRDQGDPAEAQDRETSGRQGEGSQGMDAVHQTPMGRTDTAIAWFAGALAKGPRLAREVEQEARDAGIPVRTLSRARRVLGIRTVRKGGWAGRGSWVLSLPD